MMWIVIASTFSNSMSQSARSALPNAPVIDPPSQQPQKGSFFKRFGESIYQVVATPRIFSTPMKNY